MRLKTFCFVAVVMCVIAPTTSVLGSTAWVGGSGAPLNIWSEPTNWNPASVPSSATDLGVGEVNLAVMDANGTTTLIDSSVDAVAAGVFVGAPLGGVNPIEQASSNSLVMTGGTLTTQTGSLMNVGRGRNIFDGQLAEFIMTGGVVNASGLTVEALNPADLPDPSASKGLNAEIHISGNSVINTDLLAMGAYDSHTVMTLSDNARLNLTDENDGFAPGWLWIEVFEYGPFAGGGTPAGSSLLDLRDNSLLTIHASMFSDDGAGGPATFAELEAIREFYISPGFIVANGGANPVHSWFEDGVIYLSPVPEPSTLGMAVFFAVVGLFGVRRRK